MKTNLTCPYCSSKQEEEMPVNACVPFYACNSCHKTVSAKDGDCCVFCSYGENACPLKS